MSKFINFSKAREMIENDFKHHSHIIQPWSWQGIDTSKNSAARMHELIDYAFSIPLKTERLDVYQRDIKPDLPWADDHFDERVSGEPLNPPPSEAWWPHAQQSNHKFKSDEVFSHTYPERFWPKKTNIKGIRFEVGDLGDLVNLLHKDPHTRQAVLPVFFPEDTGAAHGKRVPCTLFYRFIMRDKKINITYSIRSCDYARHYHNDCYFTVRLLLWVLNQLRKRNPVFWDIVTPGNFRIDIGSFHLFANDYITLFGAKK